MYALLYLIAMGFSHFVVCVIDICARTMELQQFSQTTILHLIITISVKTYSVIYCEQTFKRENLLENFI
jgi:hypothetical protein